VWMKGLLIAIGAPGMLAVGAVVIAIGIAIFVRDRKKEIPIRPAFFGGVILESIVYAVLVAFLVSISVSLLLAMVQDGGTVRDLPIATQLSLSLGAGLYEELVFRVILVGGLAFLLGQVTSRKEIPYVVAAVVGAFLFSAVHYIGPFGDPLQLGSFLFRFLFGLAMNVIFLLRGFGVAAWTHALYDVFVVTGFLG
ncbi:MAG: CPBP family intramembrane metalloprotease, partial [Rhodothermia bacterium]|nr:CPBP family intramembrane metalloprotease [Rhodothermia bacterium]